MAYLDPAYLSTGSYGQGGTLPHHAHLLPKILEILPAKSGLRILDVGCGNGYLASELVKRGHTVVGIDFDEKALAIAKKHHPEIRVSHQKAEDRLRQFMEDADVVIAIEVIEHIYSPQTFLANVLETLKPGGSVILTTPYHGYWKNLAVAALGKWDGIFTVHWEGGHIKFFSTASMKRMLEVAGFKSPRFRNAGRFPPFFKSIVVRAEK